MKKFMLPLVLLIAGLAIGYFVGKKNSEDFISQKAMLREKTLKEVNAQAFRFMGSGRSRPIRLDSAKLMMLDFRVQNNGSLAPMQTITNESIKGFYINREPLIEILKDSNNTGISFYMAKHHKMIGSKERYYTLVYIGAKRIIKTVAGTKTLDTTYINDGPIYDYIDPCPTVCGNLGIDNK